MLPLSVVIITKSEESNIIDCINSARLLTDDILLIDSGSNDRTVERARHAGARVLAVDWESYGASKNTGAHAARYDWIFSLDADERISAGLSASIRQLALDNPLCAFSFKRENYFNHSKIRFGTAGNDKVTRLYHRRVAYWNASPVHEKLVGEYRPKKIAGSLIHCSKDWEAYKCKLIHYAELSAEKYFREGRRASLVKQYAASAFNAVKSYIFQLGFLDGKAGFQLAKLIFFYTWQKYDNLTMLYKTSAKQERDCIIKKPAIHL